MELGIRQKLFASFGTLVAMIAGVGIVGWYNTSQEGLAIEDIYENQLKGSVSLANAEAALWKLRYGFPQYLVDQKQRQQIRAEEPQLYQQINQSLQEYRKGELSIEEQKQLLKLEDVYKRYSATRIH